MLWDFDYRACWLCGHGDFEILDLIVKIDKSKSLTISPFESACMDRTGHVFCREVHICTALTTYLQKNSSLKVHKWWSQRLSLDLKVIEVRDSRTGYFILARNGTGLGPDGRVVGTSPPSLGNSGRRSGQETIIRGFLRFWGRGERYFRMETRVRHRISLRTSWAWGA